MKHKSTKSLRKKLWKQRGKNTINCIYCGTRVEDVIGRQKFCSVKCGNKYRYKKDYIHKTENLKSKIMRCNYCHKNIKVMPHRFNRKNVFCNRDHMILFLKKNSFRMKCKVCGSIFYCQPSQTRLRNRQTCSVNCRGKMQGIKASQNRKINGFTKHQIDRCIRYSSQSENWRNKVFKRDDYTCQICHSKGGYLEAHHIKPFAYFPDLRFDINNGKTLCRKCHDKTKESYIKMRRIYEKKN
jgi:hypothetical protein